MAVSDSELNRIRDKAMFWKMDSADWARDTIILLCVELLNSRTELAYYREGGSLTHKMLLEVSNLRQALKFYGLRRNYIAGALAIPEGVQETGTELYLSDAPIPVMRDGGKQAREVLGEE